MIKFFRKIRQKLLSESKFSKYLIYAVGEIALVVIGILIALWINNLNLEHQQNRERLTLITSITQELNENLSQFNQRSKRLIVLNKKLVRVLNFSANTMTNSPLDSLKLFATNAFTFETATLNNSRLSSAKSSGRFSLLSEGITTSLTDYETSLNNYLEFVDKTTLTFDKDWFQAVIRFNSLDPIHNLYISDTPLGKHPEFDLGENEFRKYLKEPQTYELLYSYYTKYMVEKLWLQELKSKIESAIETINTEKL